MWRGQHDLVVAEVVELELLVPDPGADRRDQGLDLVVGEDLVDAALLDVDDLAAKRQDRLGVAVAALLGGAAGRVALDDEQLRQRRVLDGAVGELAGQGRVLQRRLAAGQVAGLAGRVASAGGVDCLGQDAARVGGVLLEEVGQVAVDDLLDQALDRRVPQLRLGLALELRVGELDRDDGGQALADVLAGQVLVLLLQQVAVAGDGVQRPRQGGAEAGEVQPGGTPCPWPATASRSCGNRCGTSCPRRAPGTEPPGRPSGSRTPPPPAPGRGSPLPHPPAG
jgi:hypothetical protein